MDRLRKELPGWFIEYNKDYARIDINKIENVYPPFVYITAQIVNETLESELVKLVGMVKEDIKKQESENAKKKSVIGGKKNEDGSITLTKGGKELPLRCPGLVSREEMDRVEKEQNVIRKQMSIFLTPLNEKGEEGEASKPFRFVVSFMHSEYDPRRFGFEKFEFELDAGATKGNLRLIRGARENEYDQDSTLRDLINESNTFFGKGLLRTIREYTFEEFVCTPMGIRFDNCVRI